MQKKKDRKAKKAYKSAQQTIPYVEMWRDGICKVNIRSRYNAMTSDAFFECSNQYSKAVREAPL